MVKKKPSWLTLLDFLTIAGPGIAVFGILIYFLIHGAVGPKGWQYLMALVGLSFIGIWLRIALSRRSYLAEFRWYPSYGIMAHPGDPKVGLYTLPDDDTVNNAVRETVARWALYYGKKAAEAAASDVIWVFFKKDLDENTLNRARAKVNGLTFARSHTMEVDFDTPSDPLEKTAFEHELGHIIFGFSTDNWDQQAEHDFARGHGIR